MPVISHVPELRCSRRPHPPDLLQRLLIAFKLCSASDGELPLQNPSHTVYPIGTGLARASDQQTSLLAAHKQAHLHARPPLERVIFFAGS